MNEAKKDKKLQDKKREAIHKEMLLNAYVSRKEIKVAPNDYCISLRNINKIYPNHVQAVYDFNLDIKDKEFIVFVGPSGCGKSTTLRMIAGLEDITYGDLFVGGRYANELLPKERNIAMVFQTYALYPNMSVYDNIAFSLKLKHLKKEEIKERVLKAAELLDIKQYLNRKPSALSGGQRQRVALGRAIVRDVKVFLMDEPLSNLDAKLRVQMRSEIVKLHKDIGSTTIYVTHDQTEAMTMADRIVVMRDGYIQQIGTPREIYNNPSNLFVATFIGAPAMNILDVAHLGNKITLKNGTEIALTSEQENQIKDFVKGKIDFYTNEIENLNKQKEDRLFDLEHLKHEKDVAIYKNNLMKLQNKVLQYKKDLDDAKKAEMSDLVLQDIEGLINESEEKYNLYKDSRLDEINKTDYPLRNEAKVEALKASDSTYNIILQDLEKAEAKLAYYKVALKENNLNVKFGIRPENLLNSDLASISKNHSNGMNLKVIISELLGDQYYLHTKIGETKVIAKCPTDKEINSGDDVELFIDLNKFHIFDNESTERII